MSRRARLLAALSLAALAAAQALTPGVGQTARAQAAAPPTCHAVGGLVHVPAGEVLLGEDGDVDPGRPTHVAGFWIDRHEVTNAQFAAFVQSTGYVTDAEKQGGGAVFLPPDVIATLGDPSQWWRWVLGSSWRHPQGPSSNVGGGMDEPVVQVTLADAQAYARWAKAELPTVAQWERAARAGQTAPRAQTGWAYEGDRPVANTWQGEFPVRNDRRDGHAGLAPVGCYGANAFGLYDMIGNAWEWTIDVAGDGRSGVVKGGSFLCSPSYCANFRPAGWQAQERDLPTSHIGFRVVRLEASGT